MNRFIFLILMIYLVIDNENLILANRKDVVKCKEDFKDIQNALENLLKVGVTKLKTPIKDQRKKNLIGSIYETDKKKLLFVKENSTIGSDKMFHGEFESLNAIRNTKTVLAPRPIATGHTKNKNNFLVLEYLNTTSLDNKSLVELGSQLADMHLYNLRGKQPVIKKFGFHVDTNYGFLPQNNTWTDDWITFFVENRLSYQIKLMTATSISVKSNMTALYWNLLKPKIPEFFKGIDVKPSLVHGNLRSENIGRSGSKPVIFNPATFYGHHEYDIAAKTHFGKYQKEFFDAYHKKIPKAKGYEKRILLYTLYYLISDWNQHLNNGIEMINTIDELADSENATSLWN